MTRRLVYFLLPVTLFLFASCGPQETPAESETFAVFGDTITADDAISAQEMFERYQKLKEGDTIDVKFRATIYNVCQKKGCWMNVDLTDEDVAFVRFKDYGFFMPFNAAESEAIINGKAFISVVSVDELKHYAEDEGQSQEEIDAITEPEVTYSFLADGVLIKE
jgi:hypothetical protein